MIPADKYGHFGVGAIIGLSALWFGPWSLIVVLFSAASKEVHDYSHPPHRAEWWDFIATCAGGVLSVGLVALKEAVP